MPIQDGGENIGREPEARPPMPSPRQSAGNQDPPSPPTNDKLDQNRNGSYNFQKNIRTGEYWIVGVTAFGILVNIVIACIYYGQLTQMRLATQAATQASQTAKDSLKINELNFSQMMAQTVHQTTAQLQSAKAAEGAVKAAQNQMRVDQRAWVGVTDISIKNPIVAGQKFVWMGQIENSGKSPALNTKILFYSHTALRGEPSSFIYPNIPSDPEEYGTTVIEPSSKFHIGGYERPDDPVLTEVQVRALQDGTTRMYIYGKIRYQDIFRVWHRTHVCAWVAPDLKETHPCSTYNDAN